MPKMLDFKGFLEHENKCFFKALILSKKALVFYPKKH